MACDFNPLFLKVGVRSPTFSVSGTFPCLKISFVITNVMIFIIYVHFGVKCCQLSEVLSKTSYYIFFSLILYSIDIEIHNDIISLFSIIAY